MFKQTTKKKVLTFHQFSRKGWSLFSCLHREVRIGVLGAATLACAAPRLAVASTAVWLPADELADMEAAADTLELGEAQAAATRAPLAAQVAARQVTTFSRADLEAAGITCINDVLKLSAATDVRQRGGFGVQTDISIDGGTFDQITLLLNGVPLVNPQTGHNAADFPVNLSDIERIEILEGAASRVMGSQAFSGAVNIVTRSSAEPCSPLEARVEGGSYGTLRSEARTAWQWGRGWSASASGSYGRSDGATRNSAMEGGKGYAHLGYQADDLAFDLQAGITANDFGANTFYSAAYPNQWESTRRYLVAARAETKGRLHLAPQLSWVRSLDHFQLIRHSETGENFHRGDVFAASLNAYTDWTLGRTAVGAELREEVIYSTNLGRELSEDQYVGIGGQPGRFYNRRDDRTNLSYFLEHNVVWRQFTLSAGVMAERNNAVDDKFRLYPGVDLSYRPARQWKLFASFEQSLRLPSFTDLWYKSPTQEGNIGLRPEECSAFRIGADFVHPVATLHLKAHYKRGTNMIDWVMYTPDDIYHATSFSLDSYGAGFDATFNLDALLGAQEKARDPKRAGGLNSRLSLSYAWLGQHRRKGEDYFKSNYALEYLRHKFVARLRHRIVSRLTAEWSLRVQQREGSYLVYENLKPTAETRPYGTHALLDLHLAWKAPHYTLYADLTNLTSHRYFDLANVPQPRFMAMAGVKVRI